MAGITVKTFDQPDGSEDYEHGRAAAVALGETEVWRSELLPGWSWDSDVKPYTEGLQACPLYHHEYVLEGQIRYLTEDGTEVVAKPGQLLYIEPGHRAWVQGDKACVLLDW